MKNNYLVIVYWGLIILSIVIDVGFAKTVMPLKLIEFMNDQNQRENIVTSAVDLSLTIVFILIGTYGIVFNKKKLEWFFVIGNITFAIDYLLIGFCVASGIGGFLITCYTVIAGILIGRICTKLNVSNLDNIK